MRLSKPDFTIPEKPPFYLRRWYLTPHSADDHPLKHERRPNRYLHHILRSDYDRALHDHPWDNWSFILWGGYIEHVFAYPPVEGQPLPPIIAKRRRAFQFIRRTAETAHRLELYKRKDGTERPCWSFFGTGPKFRDWGFWDTRNGVVGVTEFSRPGPAGDYTTVALQTIGLVAQWIHNVPFCERIKRFEKGMA